MATPSLSWHSSWLERLEGDHPLAAAASHVGARPSRVRHYSWPSSARQHMVKVPLWHRPSFLEARLVALGGLLSRGGKPRGPLGAQPLLRVLASSVA